MWNLIKSLNYQVKRDNFVYYVMLFGLFMTGAIVFSELKFDFENITGGMYFATLGSALPMLVCMLSVLFVPRISGWDMTDKTLNYEIMTGHSRRDIYFSRALVSVLWNVGIILGISGFGIVVFTMMNGWGNQMDMKDAFLRFGLLIFPIIQLGCELVLFTFVLKNCYMAMVLGWVLVDMVMIGCMICTELTEKMAPASFAGATLMKLMDFSNYSLKYIDGKDREVYDIAVESGLPIEVILVSIVVSVGCLFAGYVYFRRQDMN